MKPESPDNLRDALARIAPDSPTEEIANQYEDVMQRLSSSNEDRAETAISRLSGLADEIIDVADDPSAIEQEGNMKLMELSEELSLLDSAFELLPEDFSEDFRGINKEFELGLSAESVSLYAKAYLDSGKLISLIQIRNGLHSLSSLLPTDPVYRQSKLTEALGAFINGINPRIDSNSYIENAAVLTVQIMDLQDEINKKHDRLARLKKQDVTSGLKQALEFNDSWAVNAEKDVDWFVEAIRKRDRDIASIAKTVDGLESKMIDLKQTLYLNLYSGAVASGADTDSILLSAFDDLGSDAPSSLKTHIEDACQRRIADPASSEFDKLFYAGKYQEALALLSKSNEALGTIKEGRSEVYTDSEIWDLYERSAYVEYGDIATQKKVWEARMVKGSFGAKKFSEGYVPLIKPGVTMDEFYSDAGGCVLAKKREDGSISTYFVNSQGYALDGKSFSKFKDGNEHIVTPATAHESAKKSQEIQINLGKLMGKMQSFEDLKAASQTVHDQFMPLQELFASAAGGKKTKDFVRLAKDYALKLQSSNALAILRTRISGARRDLELLKKLPSGYRDQFENQILEMEKSLTRMTDMVDKGLIDNICDKVLDKSYSEDDLMSWVVKEGIVIASAIVVAVSVVVLAIPTGGVGSMGVLSMALTAAGGAAGAIVGSEVGYIISEHVGGDGYNNKSLLGNYLEGNEMFDPETGSLRPINGVDLAKTYGKEFAMAFVTTFALLGAGSLAGKALSEFALANAASEGGVLGIQTLKGGLARLLLRIPKLKPHQVDLLTQKGMGQVLKRLGTEVLEEFGEETVESMALRLGEVNGFVASLYFCLNTSRVKYSLGKFDASIDTSIQGDFGAISTFSFDVAHASDVEAQVRSAYEGAGFTVTTNPDGSIVCENILTLKDGSKKTAKMVFNPTTDSVAMREIMNEGRKADGSCEVGRLYGLKRTADNKYEFSEIAPKGKATLKTYLKMRGFVIVENADGSFSATRGNRTANFTKSKVDPNGPSNEGPEGSARSAEEVSTGDISEQLNRLGEISGLQFSPEGRAVVDGAAKLMALTFAIDNTGLRLIPSGKNKFQVVSGSSVLGNIEVEAAAQTELGQLNDMALDITEEARALSGMKNPPEGRVNALGLKIAQVSSAFASLLLSLPANAEEGIWDRIVGGFSDAGEGAAETVAGTARASAEVTSLTSTIANTIADLCPVIGYGLPVAILGIAVFKWGGPLFGPLARNRRKARGKSSLESLTDSAAALDARRHFYQPADIATANLAVTLLSNLDQSLQQNIRDGVYKSGPLAEYAQGVAEATKELLALFEVDSKGVLVKAWSDNAFNRAETELKKQILKFSSALNKVDSSSLFYGREFHRIRDGLRITGLIGAAIFAFIWLKNYIGAAGVKTEVEEEESEEKKKKKKPRKPTQRPAPTAPTAVEEEESEEKKKKKKPRKPTQRPAPTAPTAPTAPLAPGTNEQGSVDIEPAD
jgi:hypothetical protein